MKRADWIASAISLIVAVGGCNHPSADVKVYIVSTVEGRKTLMNVAVYRADAEKQAVIWWVEGSSSGPESLPNCTVRDARNWRCEFKDEGQAVVMVEGRYREEGLPPWEWEELTEAEWMALKVEQGDPR